MKLIKAILLPLLRLLAGPAFANPDIHPKTLLKSFLLQKVLRINGRTPWPVHHSTTVKAPEKIRHGSRCPGLSPHCYLDGRNGISIGSNTWIGPGVSIISMNHEPDDYFSYREAEPIEIGDNCWLGANSIILPAVRLGQHTVVAAGSVVTKSFPEGDVVIGGNPARVIKTLGPYRGNK